MTASETTPKKRKAAAIPSHLQAQRHEDSDAAEDDGKEKRKTKKSKRNAVPSQVVSFTSSENEEEDDEKEEGEEEDAEGESEGEMDADGEADVDGEGEEDDEGEIREDVDLDRRGSARARSRDARSGDTIPKDHPPDQQQRNGTSASSSSSSKQQHRPEKLNKDGLPAFKKGRAAELLANEGSTSRDRGSGGVGNAAKEVSRAPTPASYEPHQQSSGREDSPAAHKKKSSLSSSSARVASAATYRFNPLIRITNDQEFNEYTETFTQTLFPTYARLHRRLEGIQKELEARAARNKRKRRRGEGDAEEEDEDDEDDRARSPPARYGPSELAQMVEEANERGKQLQLIREALEKYSRKKESI